MSAINDHGQIVGTDSAGAFLWSPDTLNGVTGSVTHFLGYSWDQSEAASISSSGEIAGTVGGTGFLWSPQTPNGTTGVVHTDSRFGARMNDYGQTIANIPTCDRCVTTTPTLFTPSAAGGSTGTFITIAGAPGGFDPQLIAINKAGVILGSDAYMRSPGGVGFLWTPPVPNVPQGIVTVLTPPAPYVLLSPAAINARGDVAGFLSTGAFSGSITIPFLYTGGSFYDLSSLGQIGSPVAINDYGQILFQSYGQSAIATLATPGIAPPQPGTGTAPVTIRTGASSAAFTVSGIGCQPGGYNTPQILYWAAGVSCTVSFLSPQSTAVGSRLVFQNWEDGVSTNPRVIVATGQPSTYTAEMTVQYQLTVAANPPQGGTVTGGGWYTSGTNVTVNATPASSYRILDWSAAIIPGIPQGATSTTVTVTSAQTFTVNFEAVAAVPGNYQTTFLGGVYGRAVNSQGQVVGGTILWSAGASTALTGLPPGSSAVGINDSGQIAIVSTTLLYDTLYSQIALLTPGGSLVNILPSAAGLTSFAGINNYGQLAGIQNGTAFFWTPSAPNGTTGTFNNDSRFAGIAAINDFGQAIMNNPPTLFTPASPHGSTGTFTPLTGLGSKPLLVAINRNGVIVGLNSGHAFLWTPATPNGTSGTAAEILPIPGYLAMWPAAINASGQVTGRMTRPDTLSTPFLYSGGVVYDLGALSTFVRTSSPAAINDSGQIVAGGFLLSPGTTQPPAVLSIATNVGAGATQTMAFTFTDPRGWQDFDVLNVLVNTALDGRGACYLAYSVPTRSLYLVPDSGSGLSQAVSPGGAGILSNSQCAVSAAGVSVDAAGTAITLTIPLTFTSGFDGNQIVYSAARDREGGNSGWQPLATWNVPGAPANVLSAGSGNGIATYTFTFTDTNGVNDIAVGNILINSALDGRHACYIAYVAATKSVLLVDDAGDAGGPFQSFPADIGGLASNSQCAVYNLNPSLTTTPNSISLGLYISFKQGFNGNRVVYAATRSNTASSGWQAVETISIL